MDKEIEKLYKEIVQRAENLKASEKTGDGYLELYWVAERLEKINQNNG